MSEENKIEQLILERVKEKQKLVREKKIKDATDEVVSFVSYPYTKLKEFIEEKKAKADREERYQARMQDRYEQYLALFDESKIGTYETELQDFGATKKTIIHTEIGPMIGYENDGSSSTFNNRYIGFFPTARDKNDYQFIDIKWYQKSQRVDYVYCTKVEPAFAMFDGYKRNKNGEFENIHIEWENGEKYSKQFEKEAGQFKYIMNVFANEKSKAEPFKERQKEVECSQELQSN